MFYSIGAEIVWDEGSRQGKCFSNLKEFENLAASLGWSKAQVTIIFNRIPGVRTQKAFRNRPYGLQQIWKAIQRLVPSESRGGTPVAEKPASVGRSKPKKGSGVDILISLLKRKSGVSVEEAMERTGWTATHSVRGRISDLVRKGVLKIERSKDAKRGTIYRALAHGSVCK